jgi:glycosyltransferase involved in cell wall biosynthesis
MRVLHINAGNLFGGIESFLLTLARHRHLAPEMEPHIALCFPGRLRDELTSAEVPVHNLGRARLSQPWTILAARRGLKQLLRAVNYDVVVTNGCWVHMLFAPVARRSSAKLVNAVHGELSTPSRLDRWAARTSPDLVIANSQFTAESAARLFSRSPVEVVHLPVAAPVWSDQERMRRRVREELGTLPNSVVVLQASRLERWKGHTIHLTALAGLKDLPNWEAWFAGGPQSEGESAYMNELQTAAKREGIADRVRFLGQRRDVPQLMAAADIYCQPNTGPEPFGVSFVEALYAGLPVVTSKFGGAIEIIDETCGMLIPPQDVAGLIEALRLLICEEEQRRALGANGPTRASELCDPAAALARLQETLMGTGQRGGSYLANVS